jgi:hypothetical protein
MQRVPSIPRQRAVENVWPRSRKSSGVRSFHGLPALHDPLTFFQQRLDFISFGRHHPPNKQPDSRHARGPGIRLRIFASPQTTDARWLLNHLCALSSTHRWQDPARHRRCIAAIPFASPVHFFLSRSAVALLTQEGHCLAAPGGTQGIFPQ